MSDYDHEDWTPAMLVNQCEKLEAEIELLRKLLKDVLKYHPCHQGECHSDSGLGVYMEARKAVGDE